MQIQLGARSVAHPVSQLRSPSVSSGQFFIVAHAQPKRPWESTLATSGFPAAFLLL
jgi:hypothetical protein